MVWRWDGEERDHIKAADETAADVLGELGLGGGWPAADCIAAHVRKLLALADSGRDPVDIELTGGDVAFQLLICAAAVAVELERALDARAKKPKATGTTKRKKAA